MSFDHNIALTGQHLIEASAGTGKTHLLTTLYLRLVLGRGTYEARRFRPQEILVVTFTIAATQALKDRIRKRLQRAYTDFCVGSSDDSEINGLISDSEDLAIDAKYLRRALLWFDEASIYTIHGFCTRVIQDRSFDAGLLLDQSVDTQENAMLLEAAEDVFRRLHQSRPPLETEMALKQWPTPKALLQAFSPLLSMLDLHFHPTGTIAAFDPALIDDMLTAKRRWIEEEIDQLLKASALKRNVKAWHRIDAMTQFCQGSTFEPDNILWQLWTSSALPQAIKKDASPPEHPLFDLLQTISDRLGIFEEVNSLLWQDTLRQLRLHLEANQALGKLTMDNLLQVVHHAVRDQAVAAQSLGKHFPVMMIDEFQDTDRTQYAIFRSVHTAAQSSGHLLVLIGDPKQAIYRFRGADIHAYLNARGESQHHHSLTKNWRSSSELIDATNRLFDQNHLFTQNDSIRFLPSESQSEPNPEGLSLASQVLPPISFLVPDPEFTVLNKDQDQHRLATLLALQVQQWLKQDNGLQINHKPVQAAQIAVLTRDRNEAALIKTVFQAHGIDSILLSQDRVLDQPISQELATILQGVLTPNDAPAVLSALATPLMRLKLEELQALQDSEEVLEAAQTIFGDLDGVWRRQGVAAAIVRLMTTYDLSQRWLSDVEGARVLTDLRHLAELLQQQSLLMPDRGQLIRWLIQDYATADRSNLDDAQQLRLETDDNLITLMTFHGAKGLEFDVVCLPFAHFGHNKRASGSTASLAIQANEQGEYESFVNLNQDPTLNALTEQSDREENMRLLYVAMTRAKYHTVLGLGTTKGFHQSVTARLLGYHVTSPTERLSTLAADLYRITHTINPTENQSSSSAQGGATILLPMIEKPTTQTDWRIHSYSRLQQNLSTTAPQGEAADYAQPSSIPGFDDDDPEPGNDHAPQQAANLERFVFHAFPRGPIVGLQMHTLFEQLNFQQPLAEQPIVGLISDRLELIQPARGLFYDWVNAILQRPLTDTGLCLNGLDQAARADEIEFHFPLGGQSQVLKTAQAHGYLPKTQASIVHLEGMMTGSIDLLCRWQGKYYVIDYKTNHLGDQLEDYSPAGLKQAIAHHHYDLQYLIYTVALKKMLAIASPSESFEDLFGGVIYLFLRGMIGNHNQGVFFDRVDVKAIEAIELALNP